MRPRQVIVLGETPEDGKIGQVRAFALRPRLFIAVDCSPAIGDRPAE